ncbi:VWA domain-containing protein [Geobacillus subterraneus]|uniref:VWA domain-containing protein n=1 Tax=Geobacillus subterraneus TaxID=129338 RepID=UPI002AC8A68B|nr:VWA domain-containing protein [Geobacillus subterraneus]WPZ17569.1 VWA domain-containing protein [Geobacillus subterraneus]
MRRRGWLLWGMLFWLMASIWPITADVVYADRKEGAITSVSEEKIAGWATAPGVGDGKGNSIDFFKIRIQLKGQSGTAVSYRTEAVEVQPDRNGEKKYTFSLDMRGKWPSAPGATAAYEIVVDAYRVLGNGQEEVYFSFPETPYEYTRQTEASTAKLDFSLSFSQPEYAKPPDGDAQGRLDVTLIPQGVVPAPVRPPIDVVFVMDVSGSMTMMKLQSAKSALQAAVNDFKANYHPNDRFALIPFSDDVRATSVVPFGSKSNVVSQLDAILDAGNRLTANGGTNYSAALSLAHSYFNDPARKKYIIFLTDGMPTVLNATETITYREVGNIALLYYYTGKKITAALPLMNELYTNGTAGIRFTDKNGFSRLFTSDGWDYVNDAILPLGRSGYPFSYEDIERKIRNHAANAAKTLGMNNITLYSIGFGDNNEVDMDYLRALSATAGGEARQGTPQNLTELFQRFSQMSTDPTLTGTIRIPLSSFGGHVAIAENGQVWLDEDRQNAYISFSIPYEVGKPAPAPITIPVSVSFKQKGTYTFTAELTYRDVYGQLQPAVTKTVTVTVKDEVPPFFEGKAALNGISRKVDELVKNGADDGDDNRFRAEYSFKPTGYVGAASGTISHITLIQPLPDGITVLPGENVTIDSQNGVRCAKITFPNRTIDYSQLGEITLSAQLVMQAEWAMDRVQLPAAIVEFTDSRYGKRTSTLEPPLEKIGMKVRLADFPNLYYEGDYRGLVSKWESSAFRLGWTTHPNDDGLLPLPIKALQYDPNDDGVLLVTYRNGRTVRVALKPQLSIITESGVAESGAVITEAPTVKMVGLVAGEGVKYEYQVVRNGVVSDWQPLASPYMISISDDGEYTVAVRSAGGLTRGDGTTKVAFRYKKLIRHLVLGDYKETMNVGEEQRIPVAIEPADATNRTLAWTSSDPNIASVDQNGTVTALKPGTVTITVRATDGSNVQASATITVIVPLERMAFRTPVLYMEVGERLEVMPQLRFIPDHATDQTLRSVESSAPEYVAVVRENGAWVLVANDVGYATVTATANAKTSDQQPIRANVTVIVREPEDHGDNDGRNRW